MEDNKKHNVKGSLGDLLTGNLLSREAVINTLPYMLFVAFLTLLYIANGYLAEDTIRELSKNTNKLKELQSEFITTKSDLMYQSKQSQIAFILESKNMGLKESFEPPKKIIVKSLLKR